MHTPLKVVLEFVDLAGHWKPAAVSSCRSQQISFFLKLIQGDFYHLTTRVPILYPCLMVGSSTPERQLHLSADEFHIRLQTRPPS